MDTKVRKLTTCHRRHHIRADIERLYVKRENSGSGLIWQELTSKTTTIGLKKYLDTIIEWILQLVNIYEKEKKNIQLVKKAINLLNESNSYWNE